MRSPAQGSNSGEVCSSNHTRGFSMIQSKTVQTLADLSPPCIRFRPPPCIQRHSRALSAFQAPRGGHLAKILRDSIKVLCLISSDKLSHLRPHRLQDPSRYLDTCSFVSPTLRRGTIPKGTFSVARGTSSPLQRSPKSSERFAFLLPSLPRLMV